MLNLNLNKADDPNWKTFLKFDFYEFLTEMELLEWRKKKQKKNTLLFQFNDCITREKDSNTDIKPLIY